MTPAAFCGAARIYPSASNRFEKGRLRLCALRRARADVGLLYLGDEIGVRLDLAPAIEAFEGVS